MKKRKKRRRKKEMKEKGGRRWIKRKGTEAAQLSAAEQFKSCLWWQRLRGTANPGGLQQHTVIGMSNEMKSYLNEILSKANRLSGKVCVCACMCVLWVWPGKGGWKLNQSRFNLLLTFVDKSRKTDETNENCNFALSPPASHFTQQPG